MRKLGGALFAFGLSALPLSAAIVTVNDSGDSTNACATTGAGTCTLRDAMTYANANPFTAIHFSISGAGVHTIAPGSALPTIIAPMTIDGYTQPGASANTNGPTQGTNAVILIELDGTNAGLNGALALSTGSETTTIRGLAINRNSDACIGITAGSNLVIEGDFLGTDPTGMIAHACGEGILEQGNPTNITIGGTTPAARNLISGNGATGIDWGFNGGGGSGHLIEGNLIGTDATGAAALPGATQEGIILSGNTSDTTIGGTTPGARNVVSGNGANGIRTEVSSGTGGVVVEGNYVGTDVTGAVAVGNHSAGVTIEGAGVTIGGSVAGAGNVISGNATGIEVYISGGTVEGNLIGTDATGVLPLGNAGRGRSTCSKRSRARGPSGYALVMKAKGGVPSPPLLLSPSAGCGRGSACEHGWRPARLRRARRR